MRKILYQENVSASYIGHRLIGVVETACFPCKYYAGFIWPNGYAIDTETHNYHRTIDEALEALIKMKNSEWFKKLIKGN